jgi:hypothetical protein
MRPVVSLVNWDWFQTNPSIGRIDSMVESSSNLVESAVSTRRQHVLQHNTSQPNRRTTQIGFRHGIQHSIPHAVTKADLPFIVLGVRWNAKHYRDVTMDRSAERHFCDGCPDRRPCVF